jgi:hypothetical protein
MLYWLGVPVVAVYGRLAVVAPLQTEGFGPNVMVGPVLTVTENGTPTPAHPVVEFLTVRVPV